MIEYRKVLAVWHDDEDQEEMLVEVAISPSYEEGYDANLDPKIFFYFVKPEDFEQAKQPDPNGFEFTIREETE